MARTPRKKPDSAPDRKTADRLQAILEQRTRTLALRQERGALPAQKPTNPVLVCQVGRERYGIPLAAVQAVIPYSQPVPVPRAGLNDLGLVGRNGVVYTALDLGAMVKATPDETRVEANDAHLLLLRQSKPRVALRVDRAVDIATSFVLDGTPSGGAAAAIAGQARDVRSSGRVLDAGFALLDLDILLQSAMTTSPSVRSER